MSSLVDITQETGPFEQTDPKYAGMLRNLQGNIIVSHGRHFATHLFFRFNNDVNAAKEAIASLRRRGFITSALEQNDQAARNRAAPHVQEIFGTLLLSVSGLRRLGFGLPAGFGNSKKPPGPPVNFTFDQPMRAAAAELGDKPDRDWEPEYRETIDGLLILAFGNMSDNTQPTLNHLFEQAKIARDILEAGATIVKEEGGHAHVLAGEPREHFGFVDGISQPLFRQSDIPPQHDAFDPSDGLVNLLVPDPFTQADDAFASFFVFRKLEQNVRGWREAVAATAGRFHLPPALVGGMAVGRFQNGDPAVLSAEPSGANPQDPPPNNFEYSVDVPGLRCPYHAHIRKTNPRGDTDRNFGNGDGKLTPDERNRRIARRGITYGKRARDLSDAPETGVGLLFMCYQANIPDQFGFMQKNWVNDDGFGRSDPPPGQDAVIGQGTHEQQQIWPTTWGGPNTTRLPDFGKFVTNRGGEFFLAVSIPTIEAMAG